MARTAANDRAKAKAQKQKRLAIGLSIVLVILVAVQGPKTMRMLHSTASAPIVDGTAAPAAPTVTPAAAPTPTVTPTAAPVAGALVSAVQVTPDAGQLQDFARFASKDPFAAQVDAGADAAKSSPSAASAPTPAAAQAAPAKKAAAPPPAAAAAAAPPSNAVISLNGELSSVVVGGAFPTSGATFDRVGALFQLSSLTKSSAKVTVVGGSYASGVPAITLRVGVPLTLQNTADGTRYTLILEPQGTPVPVAAPVAAPAATPAPAPSSGG